MAIFIDVANCIGVIGLSRATANHFASGIVFSSYLLLRE